MMEVVKVILSGGGTGGHIYPAIAIANEIKSRFPNANIMFVGAKGKMEMEKVPKSGYPIQGLWISGIHRKFTWSNLIVPFKLLSSLWKANKIINTFKPDVVIGTGGFASGATLLVANFKRIPTLVQEQNSYPGITNKILSKKAKKICVAYDNLECFFDKNKLIKTGNPVRQDILKVNEKRVDALRFFGINGNKKIVLVIGGSLGARRINQLIEAHLDMFAKNDVQVIWQCGKLYYQEYNKYNDRIGVQVHQFLDKMDFAYSLADIVVSRAGASSVSELCIVAKPTIFIPSPNVAEDHQTKNAQAIVDKKGAVLIKESELDTFVDVFEMLLNDPEMQAELSKNISYLALPNATKVIVDQIIQIVK